MSSKQERQRAATSKTKATSSRNSNENAETDDETHFRSVRPALSAALLGVVEDGFGFSKMTPVQQAVLPLFLSFKDVAVEACTGSGKTLSFVLPIFQMLLRREAPIEPGDRKVLALVILPTRELATQVSSVIQPFMNCIPTATLQLFIGGEDVHADVDRFKEQGGTIVVGTPGRLWDLISRVDSMNLRELEVLILDEADRLLDMGFENTINSILQKLPKQRRTGLFSATLTEGVAELVKAGMRNPVKVSVRVEDTAKGVQTTPESLTNWYMVVENNQKLNALISFLKKNKDQKTIVYFLTCYCVEYFTKVLSIQKLKLPKIFSLHGKLKHKKRASTLQEFTQSTGGILLATDLAARGLDIPDVNWVIQYDPPQDPKSFLHRIGRTARMGRLGSAIVYLTPQEDTYVDFMKVRKVPMQKLAIGSLSVDYLDIVKESASKDRDIYEKGQRAAVSYVRAYKEHHCNFIFKLKDFEFGKLFTGFGLLRAPRMPEVKEPIPFFEPTNVDVNSLKYTDKNREKLRQKILKDRTEKAMASIAEKETAKGQKRRQMEAKFESSGKRTPKKGGQQSDSSDFDEDDDDDFNEDYKMIKKAKKRRLSEKDLQKELGEDELFSDSEVAPKSQTKAKPSKSKDDSDDDDDDSDDSDDSSSEPKQKHTHATTRPKNTSGAKKISAWSKKKELNEKRKQRKAKRQMKKAMKKASDTSEK